MTASPILTARPIPTAFQGMARRFSLISQVKARMASTPSADCRFCTPTASLVHSLYRPSTGDQVNAAVGADWETLSDALAQSDAIPLGQRHAVARRRALSPQKWRPVVIKILESRRHNNCCRLRALQSGCGEELHERFRPAVRESIAFVKGASCRIECNRSVPKIPHELHVAGVIPDIGRNGRP